jgi:rSAM/selenodomain-associated transferase 2/rSAM/selenodomain-associated transferase 1
MSEPFVSIVVPVLGDAASFAHLLTTLHVRRDVEIIVVNGGPPDSRLDALTDLRTDIRLVSSSSGRGRQMNAGAVSARGRWLLFLHADTRLPSEWIDEVRRADEDPAVAGGSFRFRLDSTAYQARLIERGVRLRVRWFGLAYGDQALFVRREAFHAIGGYREWPLMEDVDLVRRLRRVGRLYHSAFPAVTSARRWERDGWWRRSAENVILQLLFFVGVSPAPLARRYLRSTNPRTKGEAVVIMARAPSDTRGKSRLTGGLPGDGVELRRAILLDTLDCVAPVHRADLFVAFEPADALLEILALTSGTAQLFAQRGDILGDRMRSVFADLFGRGYTSVVMIGSDVPTLPAAYVEQAFTRLCEQRRAVVIGPATDGGYYLIGLGAPHAELFESIPWSTPDVLAATVKVARGAGMVVSLTPEWYDVDEPEDARPLMNEIMGGERTRSWIARHPGFMDRSESAASREVRGTTLG